MILKKFIFNIHDKIAPIEQVIETSNEPGYILNLNLFALELIIKNKKFRDTFYGARLVHVDGKGAGLVLSCLLGKYFKSIGYRQWGSNIFEDKKNKHIFFLGGTEIENKNAVNNVSSKFLHLSVAGINGYVSDKCKVETLKKTKANLIFVGIGMPDQELLIKHLSLIFPDKTFFACGGWIKQLSGLENDCPKVVSVFGLEWLFRSFRRPGHLSERVIKPAKIVFWDILDR